MCLPFLHQLKEGLNTRFEAYGSMICKINAFVPSVIGMGKVEGNNKTDENKMIIRFKNTEINYRLPEIPSKNTQGGKDDGKLFQRKFNLVLWQMFGKWIRAQIYMSC